MASRIVLFVCVQAILAQYTFGQLNRGCLPALGSINSNSVVENTVVVGNNAGIGGVGLANAGLIGSNVGLANSGLLGSGISTIGLTNNNIIGSNAGLANTGLLGSGLSGIGLTNTGIGNTVLPAINTNYLDLSSVSSGGVLPINSFSPIVPVGLTVVSENAIEGPVTVVGQLPFLSAVAFEGALASGGSGAAGCGCGSNGNVGIISETYGSAAPGIGLGFGGRLL